MSATTDERPTEAPVEPVTEEEGLRQEAIASLKRKRRFAEDTVAYVAVNGVLWLIWALTDRSLDGGMPWPAWVSIIWGFFLALDAWKAYGSWPRSLHRPLTEGDVAREMERRRRDSTRRSRSAPLM
jgi:2TM domain